MRKRGVHSAPGPTATLPGVTPFLKFVFALVGVQEAEVSDRLSGQLSLTPRYLEERVAPCAHFQPGRRSLPEMQEEQGDRRPTPASYAGDSLWPWGQPAQTLPATKAANAISCSFARSRTDAASRSALGPCLGFLRDLRGRLTRKANRLVGSTSPSRGAES